MRARTKNGIGIGSEMEPQKPRQLGISYFISK